MKFMKFVLPSHFFAMAIGSIIARLTMSHALNLYNKNLIMSLDITSLIICILMFIGMRSAERKRGE
jgi:hypothetical protein